MQVCEDFEDGTSFLATDYSIDCLAPERGLWLGVVAVAILLFTVATPVVYFRVLWTRRHLINPVHVVKNFDHANKEHVNKQLAFRNRQMSLRPFRGLFSAYEPRYYYMEVALLVSKVLLTGFVVFAVRCGMCSPRFT